MAHLFIFALAGVISWTAAFVTLLVIACFNSIWIATGLYLSLRLAKATAAVIINLLLPILLYGGVSLVLATAGAFLRNNTPQPDHLAEQACWYLPYFYMVNALHQMRPDHAFTSWRLYFPATGADIPPLDWLGSVLIPVCLIHLLVAFLLLIWTTVRFNRIVGRASQFTLTEP